MNIDYLQCAAPALISAIAAVILYIVRGIIFRIASRWAGRTDTRIDDIVVESVRVPSLYWCAAIGLYTGLVLSDLPGKYVRHFSQAIYVIIIISVTITCANLAGKVFREYLQKSGLPIPTTGLAYGMLKGTILVAGFLVMLNFLGISITPLLTAMGVGGLAVALALQDTLANLFTGLHILMEQSIRVSHA